MYSKGVVLTRPLQAEAKITPESPLKQFNPSYSEARYIMKINTTSYGRSNQTYGSFVQLGLEGGDVNVYVVIIR